MDNLREKFGEVIIQPLSNLPNELYDLSRDGEAEISIDHGMYADRGPGLQGATGWGIEKVMWWIFINELKCAAGI